MAEIVLRDIEDGLAEGLRRQALRNRRTVEAEVLEIVKAAVDMAPPLQVTTAGRDQDLGAAIRARFAPFGGLDVPLPPREPMRDPVILGE